MATRPSVVQEVIADEAGIYAGMALFFLLAGCCFTYGGVTGWGMSNGQGSTNVLVWGVIMLAVSLFSLTYIAWTVRMFVRSPRR